MKNCFLSLFIVLISFFATLAQSPTIDNQTSIGTSLYDFFYDVIAIDNNKNLLCFSVDSVISGNKTTTNFGSYDAWVVNLNPDYSINWQKNFGGIRGDGVVSALKLLTNDVLLFCFSESGISGNKTVDSIGGSDYWLVKIDPLGNIMWQKTYGGIGVDNPVEIIEYKDGFLLYGTSSSPISGDKTESSRGSIDFWVVRIDQMGDVIWDKTIGSASFDLYPSLCTNDDDIFLLGRTDGGASGDKNENSYGFEDAWVIKLDSNGVLVNQKSLGGDNLDYLSDIFTLNNKLYLNGFTTSSISGNKTSSLIGLGNAWLLQLDFNLNILNDKTIGGENYDALYNSIITSQNQIVYGGSSGSNINQWKDINSRGDRDVWLVAFDTLDNQLWNTAFGGSATDDGVVVIEKSQNVYSTFNFSNSSISGDKTTPNLGSYDLWIVEISTTLEILEQDQQMVYAYPNPSTTQLFIQSDLVFEKYKIYDMAGRLVEQADFNSTITTSQLKNGVYQLIISNKDTSRRVRFVKE